MTGDLLQKQKRLFLISASILLLGLSSAVAIYLAADGKLDEGQSYEVAGGKIYPAMQERSKKYMHDLELYGGKAAVLADDFNRWFDGLWRGQMLAFTVAGIAALLALGFFAAARSTHPDQDADCEREEDRT